MKKEVKTIDAMSSKPETNGIALRKLLRRVVHELIFNLLFHTSTGGKKIGKPRVFRCLMTPFKWT